MKKFIKMKKAISIVLTGIMVFSMAACSGNTGNTDGASGTGADSGSGSGGGSASGGGDRLVIWTLADDLVSFADRFDDLNPDIDIETVVIAPADYPLKIQSALLGGAAEPDIIVAEPQMLGNMFEAGFFEDLDQAPYNAQDYADKIVDYVWDVGKDQNGIQRAISYQITPAGIFYRRDIAENVFGTSDSEEIGKLFSDYNTVRETAVKVKNAGYRIFASDAEMNTFSGDSAWVIDGKLNVDQGRYDYMDLCIDLFQNDLTAFASQWAAPWYQAMSGPVPILTAETQWGTDEMNIWDEESFNEAMQGAETTEVFAFGLPSWGVLTMRDNVGDTSGLWGVTSGPSYGFGGGTFIGISSNSNRKDLAWEFLKFCTLDEETSDWWVEFSEGDTVSYIPTLEKFADTENPIYGNQKLYSFWLKQAEGIDYSKITKYDTAIADAWGAAITAIKTGEKNSDAAINDFYDTVAATYPEISIER